MKAKFGTAPIIQVFIYDDIYLDYVLMPYPQILIKAAQILFDFGGFGSGWIKIA